MFSSLHYRHSGLRRVFPASDREDVVFEGGVFEPEAEKRSHRAVASLMGGRIGREELERIDCEQILKEWTDRAFLEPAPDEIDIYQLTANGSWFVDHMIGQLRAQQSQIGR